ncbi:MAG TPA: TRCF domain-containing protein, partial [Microbacterium sp.]|nr:TRCF domain-containing protein [Microbacterium sp.]
FDLYLRMIGEAVSEFRGEDTEGPVELRLELPIEARIPESYIDSERLRLEAYQKLSAAATAQADDDAIDRVVEELTDRYGEPPVEVTGLVDVARLRRRAAQSHLSDVVAMGKNLRIAPGSLPDSMQVRLKRLYPGAKVIGGADALLVPLPAAGGELLEGSELLAWVRRLLDALFPLPKSEDAPADQ